MHATRRIRNTGGWKAARMLRAAALLLEQNPDMTNRDAKLRFKERAVDLGLPRNQQGWGALDIGRLLE